MGFYHQHGKAYRDRVERSFDRDALQGIGSAAAEAELSTARADEEIRRSIELGLEAADTWFVGDEWRADIQGASRAGMVPLLAPGAPPIPDPAVRRLRSFEELGELIHSPPGEGD